MNHFNRKISLNESLMFDQDNAYSYNSELPSSQTEIQDMSRQYYIQFQSTQLQKKNQSMEKGNISQSKNQQKLGISMCTHVKQKIQKVLVSSLRPKTQRDIIQFICFNSRKIILKNDEIRQFIEQRQNSSNSSEILCYEILDKVIRRLFLQENMMEINSINLKSFSMTSPSNLTGEDNKMQQKTINNEPIYMIYSFQEIYITRNERIQTASLLQKQKKVQQDQLRIVSPDLVDFIYFFDKNKTFLELKEAISIYYYNFVGKIIFVSYRNFTLIDMNKRICDLSDKNIEIYEEKIKKCVDKAFCKENSRENLAFESSNIVVSSLQSKAEFQQVMINESLLKGRLFLKIQKNRIIQRTQGSLLNYFFEKKQISKSLLILTGMKIQQKLLYLQFTYKSHKQIVKYFFTDILLMNKLITTILTITRIFNHKLQILQQ